MVGGREPLGPGELEDRLDGALLDLTTGQWTSLSDLPAGDPFRAPGLVAANVAEGRLIVVRLVSTEAFVLDPGGIEWRSLGASGVDRFLEPVGVAAGRWLFAGKSDDGTDVVAALDLRSGSGRRRRRRQGSRLPRRRHW